MLANVVILSSQSVKPNVGECSASECSATNPGLNPGLNPVLKSMSCVVLVNVVLRILG